MSNNGTDLSPTRPGPVVDFTSLDFEALRADFITYAQGKFSDRWTDFNDSQFAVVFLELLAYLGDLLTFQLNASIRETFSSTAVRQQNIANLLKAFALQLDGPQAATVSLDLTLDAGGIYPFTIGRADHSFSNGISQALVNFHPTDDVVVAAFPGNPFAVACTEGEFFDQVLIGVSDGLPNQRWQFPQTNVLNDSALVITVGNVTWTSTTNFTEESSTAEVYKLVQTDTNQTFAVFGDGTFGSIPPLGAEIRATFVVGGGSRGNVNNGVIDTIVAASANVLAVTNPNKSSGGANAESLKEARNVIPNSLRTLERAVTGDDYASLAVLVSGVAKAFGVPGVPAGARVIRVFIAPTGGGVPTTALKNTVLTSLNLSKMVTNRVRVFDPLYRDLRLELLLHVNPAFRAEDVRQRTRNILINSSGSGVLDFGSLNFAGLDADTKELLISNTKLQDQFAGLKNLGLDRAEILRLDVTPEARARDGGNTGSGSIADASIILNTNQRRRRFLVNLTSASQYEVFEQIQGYVSELTDTVLTDDTKIFGDEGVSSFANFLLQPDIADSTTITVVSAAAQAITVTTGTSLFALTAPGTEYLLFSFTPAVVAVDSEFTSADGSVKFTVASGTIPFINGDSFTLDIYPLVGDIRLRDDEYPQLVDADLITRTSGGAGV